MKTSRILLLSALALAGAGVAHAFDPVKGLPKTEVVFFEAQNFTDARDSYMGSDAGRDATLAQLKDYLVKRATRLLAPGQTLTITITDVDLAGEFEPWRGPEFSDVRIVRDIYPPRINLTFRVTEADGKVVKEGKRVLRDLAFMDRLTMAFKDDPLRHEKALLDDWMSDDLGSLKPR
jgi:hypothetical protein